jgi:hypothetical protein
VEEPVPEGAVPEGAVANRVEELLSVSEFSNCKVPERAVAGAQKEKLQSSRGSSCRESGGATLSTCRSTSRGASPRLVIFGMINCSCQEIEYSPRDWRCGRGQARNSSDRGSTQL